MIDGTELENKYWELGWKRGAEVPWGTRRTVQQIASDFWALVRQDDDYGEMDPDECQRLLIAYCCGYGVGAMPTMRG